MQSVSAGSCRIWQLVIKHFKHLSRHWVQSSFHSLDNCQFNWSDCICQIRIPRTFSPGTFSRGRPLFGQSTFPISRGLNCALILLQYMVMANKTIDIRRGKRAVHRGMKSYFTMTFPLTQGFLFPASWRFTTEMQLETFFPPSTPVAERNRWRWEGGTQQSEIGTGVGMKSASLGKLSLRRCCIHFKLPLRKGKADVAPVQEAAEHSGMSHQLEKAVWIWCWLCFLLT